MDSQMSHPSWAASAPGRRQATRWNREVTIRAIHHIQLAMPPGGEETAREFLLHVLGFDEITKPAELAKRGGAWFRSGGVELHLGVEDEFRPARKAHPAFLVDDLESILARAGEAGNEIDTSQPSLDGYKRAFVFDPFGNRIELMERI